MKIKKVVLDPAPCLHAPNAAIEMATWDDLEPNVRKMFKVMYRTGIGVGLAAPQVGWNVRLFIMNADSDTCKPSAERIYWNPEIETFGEPEKMNEGCLSLPGVYGDVPRYKKIRLKAMTPNGEVGETIEGYSAQIVQHEMGHLNGQLCSELFASYEEHQKCNSTREDCKLRISIEAGRGKPGVALYGDCSEVGHCWKCAMGWDRRTEQVCEGSSK